MDVRAVEDLIYRRSGLLGVSGISSDMRTLLASDDPHARFAIELYVYRIARELGSLAAAMEGIDAIVFTAGIGEHAAVIREGVMRRAAWLGVEIDVDAKGRRAAAHDGVEPRVGVGDPDQRRTDDRAPYAPADPVSAVESRKEPSWPNCCWSMSKNTHATTRSARS